MKELSEITVVMTAYNGRAYIEEQIESILKGDFSDFSIHVYDDGSTDGTRELLGELSKKYPDKLVFFPNPENKGVIRNFMEGACAAKSPYIMFADQDDVWVADKLSKTLQIMKEREKAVGKDKPIAVFADAKVVNEKLEEIAPSFHGNSHLDTSKVDFSHLLMENKLIGCTMMINQAMQKKLFVIPKKIRMHDWWIGLIGAAMGEIAYLPEPMLLYRQHEKNVVGSKTFGSYIKARVSALDKQKLALLQTEEQAEAFLSVFGDELSLEKKEIAEAFVAMKTAGFFKKRRLLFKYGFWKTGLVRNIGVFLLI